MTNEHNDYNKSGFVVRDPSDTFVHRFLSFLNRHPDRSYKYLSTTDCALGQFLHEECGHESYVVAGTTFTVDEVTYRIPLVIANTLPLNSRFDELATDIARALVDEHQE